MRVFVLLTLIVCIATPVYAVMRGRDNIGDIKVNTLKIGDVIGKTTVRVDVDGDGRRDTLDIYFQQVAFVVSLRDRGEEVILSYFECGDTNVSLGACRETQMV